MAVSGSLRLTGLVRGALCAHRFSWHILGEAWEGQSPRLTGPSASFRLSVRPWSLHLCPRNSSWLRLSLSDLLSYQWLLLSEGGSHSGDLSGPERGTLWAVPRNFWAPPWMRGAPNLLLLQRVRLLCARSRAGPREGGGSVLVFP